MFVLLILLFGLLGNRVWIENKADLNRKLKERERERDDYNTLTKKWPNCTARPKKIFAIITYVHFDQNKNIIVHIFLYSRPIWIWNMHKKVKNRMEVLLLTKKKMEVLLCGDRYLNPIHNWWKQQFGRQFWKEHK